MSAASTISVELADGRTVTVEVRRSDRARATRVQVGSDVPLRVIVPAGASDELAHQAVTVKSAWIARKLDAVEQARQRPQLGLDQPGVVWLHGSAVPVVRADVEYARLDGEQLLVPDDDDGSAVERWYRREAREQLKMVVVDEAHRLDLRPTSVAVRAQRTRWGSCSSAGRLSLNWRLLIMPEHVARYVVVHELVHLKVPNHSKAFWRALAGACPGWRSASAWLAEHGDEVRRYEPAMSVAGDAGTDTERPLVGLR